jgi:hypothetical protein
VPTPDNQEEDKNQTEIINVSLPKESILPATRPVSREATAAGIAKVIVWTFTGCIAFCCVVVFIQVIDLVFSAKNSPDRALNTGFELFKTVSAVMSGPLGFVLGFYFRDRGDD